jgi:hypothetical protein
VNDMKQVRVRVERRKDGSYGAWDTSGRSIAEGENFAELRDNLDEVIRAAHGAEARPVLVVGRQLLQFPTTLAHPTAAAPHLLPMPGAPARPIRGTTKS